MHLVQLLKHLGFVWEDLYGLLLGFYNKGAPAKKKSCMGGMGVYEMGLLRPCTVQTCSSKKPLKIRDVVP